MLRHQVALLLVWTGCGRIGFEAAPPRDSPLTVDATTTATWLRTVAIAGTGGGSSENFTGRAALALDAILFHVYCGSVSQPTDVMLSAPGWSIAQLSPIAGSTNQSDWAATFGAIADTDAYTSFTLTWVGADCSNGIVTLADEITGNNPSVTDAFYGETSVFGNGSDATVVVQPDRVGDLIWAGCSGSVFGVGPGAQQASDDMGGDWTAFENVDVPGSSPLSFLNQPGKDYIVTSAIIRHR